VTTGEDVYKLHCISTWFRVLVFNATFNNISVISWSYFYLCICI